MSVLANFSPNEGTVTTTVTITFPWRARKIIITNNDASRDLEFKFNTSEDYGTLRPYEEVSVYHHSNTVYLNSPSLGEIDYRVWGFG